MNTTSAKLNSLVERRQEVERELSDIIASKAASPQNTALADLESILNSELSRIDEQMKQLNAYLNSVQDAQQDQA
ncbi:MAG: hypothetical protein HZA51_13300 [Planctomycetes bacterium]|nr:hypothetical protein [Planctomycetota bacterium]